MRHAVIKKTVLVVTTYIDSLSVNCVELEGGLILSISRIISYLYICPINEGSWLDLL